ncbi:putative choline transport protein [Aspergillus affinis]|uniref:putative choline transport protein n=1 Tax=Aspergillus affinis TaxID=1070780 RepID=UPI0022FE1B09|nr:putative choline transport protein [Aspergillus affinis]KAI9044533.1 putative choline transport protein [Aspergillus affinis]
MSLDIKPTERSTEVEKIPDVPLSSDDAVLQAQGHRAELNRSFSWVGAIGFAFSISNAWLGYAATIGSTLLYGGGQTALFGPVLAAVATTVVFQGLAELSSAFPSSGGQYHYTYIMAPSSIRNFLAYLVGICNILGWWMSLASGTIIVATSTFGVVAFWYPDFETQQWQVYLCYVLTIVLSLIPVFVIPQKRVDHMVNSAMALSIFGFFAVIITCLSMGKGNYHPEMMTQYDGASGWSRVPAWLLSINLGQYAFMGNGAVTHIAEEMPRPGRNLPLVLNMAQLIGVITAIPWTMVVLCGVQDMHAVQNSFHASMEMFYQSTGSKTAATVLQSYLILLYYSCLPSQWITCSRIAWAFSRDAGLPVSSYWNHISPKYKIPVRTTFLTAVFCLIYGLLYIASTDAFNSIINMSFMFLTFTYVAPQTILLFGRRESLPKRPFNLGRWGYAVNAFSTAWFGFTLVLVCFPTQIPATKGSMNYGAAVAVGVFVLVMILWLERRKKFAGPNIDWDMLKRALE